MKYLSSDILKLYGIEKSDRRKSVISVENDRRSGLDRRSPARNLNSQITEDFNLIKEGLNSQLTKGKSTVFSALETIAPVRRFEGVSDNIKDSNYTKAAGLLGLAVVNLPEDTRDLKYALKEIIGTEVQKYDPKEFQTEFSFFRGTFLEPLINKLGKFGVTLHKLDKSLYNTKFGKYLQNKLNIEIVDIAGTERYVPKITLDSKGGLIIEQIEVNALKLEGKPLSKFIGRVLLRTPVIGLTVLAALELPVIIKSFIKPNNAKEKMIGGASQTIKSTINIAAVTAGVGVMGSLLARKGHVGSLAGIGIGAVAGMKIANELKEKVDHLENKINSNII